MKTDSIFYRIFKTAPVLFFELIGQTQYQGYQFESIEIKETAFRIDGVFLPPAETPEQSIFFVEVQFQKDEQLYHRLFAELFLFLRYNPDTVAWRAVVFFARRSIEPKTQLFDFLLTSSQVQRFYLDELIKLSGNSPIIGLLQLIIRPKKQVIDLAQELWTQVQDTQLASLPQTVMLELIETILVYKFPQMSRQEIGKMLGLAESAAHTRVYQEGLEQGLERGIERGVEQEKRDVALRMLRKGMDLELIAQLTELSIDQIKQLQSSAED